MSFIDQLSATMRAMGMQPAQSSSAVPPAPVIPPADPNPVVTATLLKAMGTAEPEAWAPILNAACKRHGITTGLRAAAWLANILNETGGLRVLRESLNYSADALLKQWPSHFNSTQAQLYGRTALHPANEQMIAEMAYGGRGGNGPPGSGDGWFYRGGGGMQTTFYDNYLALAKVCGKDVREMPAWVQTKEGAAESAAFFWESAKCNVPADRGDITTVRRIVNGGSIGLPNVIVLYNKLVGLMK